MSKSLSKNPVWMRVSKKITIIIIIIASIIFLVLSSAIRTLSLDDVVVQDQDRLVSDLRAYFSSQDDGIPSQCAPAIYEVNTSSPCESDIRPHFDSSICRPVLVKVAPKPLSLISHPVRYDMALSSYQDLTGLYADYRNGLFRLTTKGKVVGFDQVYCKKQKIYIGIIEFKGEAWPW